MSADDTNPAYFAGKPDRANCGALYPSTIKGSREYFSANVIAGIDIRMDGRTSFEAVPAPRSRPRKTWLVFLFCPLGGIRGGKRVTVQETGEAFVGFFREDDGDTHCFGFVGQHLDELCMRDLHKLLIVLLPQMDFLFPEPILADDQRANPFGNQEVNDPTAGGMQIMHDAPIALRRDRLKETRGLALVAGTGQAALPESRVAYCRIGSPLLMDGH